MKKYLISILMIVVGFLALKPNAVEKKYKEHGIPVVATVTEIKHVLKHTTYRGYYAVSEGNYVDAEIIANSFGVDLEDELEGYVLPEEPYKVYCVASTGVMLIVKVLGGILGGLGILCFILFIKSDFASRKNQSIA